ncbi:MAG: cytidylate kinase [Candidatus Azotimanducaceae bacterium]|jgi:cytidylate kinase
MPSSDTFKIIAMDGGAAVGKSSTSKGLAEELGLMHVDTGAHYRTLTYALLATGADPDQPERISEKLAELTLDTVLQGRSAKLSINGQVPADADIRSPEVNAAVSKFAAIEPLRTFLFDYQRSQADIARAHGYSGLIMEGRDIGSVIFPNAVHRFFLHADETTRTARRAKEGQTDSIAERDQMDKSRKTAPLVCPEGATKIDTGPHTLEEVIEIIARLISKDGLL